MASVGSEPPALRAAVSDSTCDRQHSRTVQRGVNGRAYHTWHWCRKVELHPAVWTSNRQHVYRHHCPVYTSLPEVTIKVEHVAFLPCHPNRCCCCVSCPSIEHSSPHLSTKPNKLSSRSPHLINQHKHECIAVLHQLMDARKQAPHQLAALWGHTQRQQHRHTRQFNCLSEGCESMGRIRMGLPICAL